MRDSLYFVYVLAPLLCMRVVIFKRAHVYLNEENEGLYVVQRGKAGLFGSKGQSLEKVHWSRLRF